MSKRSIPPFLHVVGTEQPRPEKRSRRPRRSKWQLEQDAEAFNQARTRLMEENELSYEAATVLLQKSAEAELARAKVRLGPERDAQRHGGTAGRHDENEPITKDEINELHSEAFRDLECRISDCEIMASIAVQLVEPFIGGRDRKHERALFAVCQVATMLQKLKTDYYAAWHGDRLST